MIAAIGSIGSRYRAFFACGIDTITAPAIALGAQAVKALTVPNGNDNSQINNVDSTE